MNPERMRELEFGSDTQLTDDEVELGWHFCADWDFMLISKDSPEFEIECHCKCMERWKASAGA